PIRRRYATDRSAPVDGLDHAHALRRRDPPLRLQPRTGRQALRANLPDTDTLTTNLVDALHHVLPLSRRDRRRRWPVAVAPHGALSVGCVVLDIGFDSGETILLLPRRGLSYTVPLRRKGRGTNRRNACFAWASGTIATVRWQTEKTNQAVATKALAWKRRNQE